MTTNPSGSGRPGALEALSGSAVARPRRGRGFTWGRLGSWLVFIIGVAYFLLPLLATLLSRSGPKPLGRPTRTCSCRPRLRSTLIYSALVG